MPPLAQISGNRLRKPQTTPEERAMAFGMRLGGCSWPKIAKAVGHPESTIRLAVKRSDNREFNDKPSRGRKSLLDNRTKRYIINKIEKEPKIPYKTLLPAVGLHISNRRSVSDWLAT